MKLSELRKELEGLDPDAEVTVRLHAEEDQEVDVDDVIGTYCTITDHRNISVENGMVVIIGDLVFE